MRCSQRGDDIHSDFRTRNEIQKGGYLVTLTIFPVKPGGCHCVYLAKFLLCHISADFAECSGVSWIVCILYGCSSECKSLPTEKFLLGRTERKLFFFLLQRSGKPKFARTGKLSSLCPFRSIQIIGRCLFTREITKGSSFKSGPLCGHSFAVL